MTRRLGLLGAAGLACATLVAAAPAVAASLKRSTARALSARITLTRNEVTVPGSFLGLSIEYNELSSYEAQGPLFDRAMSVIRPQNDQPLLLRLGGRSADDAYWNVATTNAPRWVFELDNAWLARLSRLVRRDDLRVMLDLNLAVHSPEMAAAFASAAVQSFPPRRLAALSIGNEPDLYQNEPGLRRERIASTAPSTPADWPDGYSPADYRRDYRAYAQALSRAAPGVPIGAPEVANSRLKWVRGLTTLGGLSPRFITVHRYGGSTCFPATSPFYPTIQSLLRDHDGVGLASGFHGVLDFAQARDLRVRVTEFNSVSCGGKQGVSNSFASALFVLDAMFEMIHAGVDSVTLHIRPHLLDSPFEFSAGGMEALPELYGLATFAQMIRSGARLVGTRLKASRALNLKVWAVKSRAGLTVLLINKGPLAASSRVATGPATGPAQLGRLWAPSVTSTAGITLAGRSIGPDARWHGLSNTRTVDKRAGAYRVLVPGYSAALLTLRST